MNYELCRHARPMTRTSVRLYVVVVHQMWNFPTIMNYELRIMNYEGCIKQMLIHPQFFIFNS